LINPSATDLFKSCEVCPRKRSFARILIYPSVAGLCKSCEVCPPK
jgi:hypothetical protein